METPQQTIQTMEAQPVVPQAADPIMQPKKSNKGLWVALGCGCAFFIFVICAVIVFIFVTAIVAISEDSKKVMENACTEINSGGSLDKFIADGYYLDNEYSIQLAMKNCTKVDNLNQVNEKINNGRNTRDVGGDLKYKDGSKRRIEYTLLKQGNDWKIVAIKLL